MLANLYVCGRLVCMKTTLNIDLDLIARAKVATGIQEKTTLIH